MTVSPERHRAISDAFGAWFELPDSERGRYLGGLFERDPALAQEVKKLIAAAAASPGFLEEPCLTLQSAGATDAPDQMLGRRLGAYRIQNLLGLGGMGRVYLAVRDDGQFESQVAIKILAGNSRAFTAADIRRERHILAGLNHPYIAHLIDGGDTDAGDPYLVMQLVDGQPITGFCNDQRLDLRQRLRLFLKICDAVEYAHRSLVLHLDLKPSNILVGADGVPKLLDFGIAQLLKRAPAARDNASIPLTPEYASPEQLRGESLTTVSDVYSLGVVLYELVAGKLPYPAVDDDSDLDAVAAKILTADPQRPSDVHRDNARARRVDRELDAICLKALRKLPAERYGTVAQLAADLRRYLDGTPVEALEYSAIYQLQKFISRHRLGSAAALVAVAALVATAFIAQRQAEMARTARNKSEQRLGDLRRLANSTVLEFDRAIQDLPGSTTARRLVIARGLEYLERVGQDTNDVGVLREMARGYQQIGRLQGNPYYSNLGDLAGAKQSYQRAVALREKILVLASRPVKDQISYADLLREQADIGWAEGQFEASLQLTRRACALLGNAALGAAPDAGLPHYQGGCAYSTGQLLVKMSRFADAAAMYRLANSFYTEANRLRPAAEDLSGAAVSTMKLGDALYREGDFAAARTSMEESLSTLDRMIRLEGETASNRRLKAYALDRLATTSAALRDYVSAIGHSRDALALAEGALRGNSKDKQALNEVPMFRSNLGFLLLLSGETRAAESALALSLEEFERAARYAPDSIDQRSTFGVALRYRGDVQRALGKIRGARASYLKALEKLEAEPRDGEYEAELAAVYFRLSQLPAADAASWLEKSMATWRSAQLHGFHPNPLVPVPP